MKQPLPGKSLLFCLLSLFFYHLSFAQPNNTCGVATATLIITDSACVNGTSSLTGQTLTGATADGGAITSNCTALNSPDVWYKFVAKTQFPTVTVSNLGAGWGGVANLKIQILSGSCGSFTEMGCATGSASATPLLTTPLIPGDVCYIRIFKVGTGAPAANSTFDICIKDPLTKAGRMNEVFSKTILSPADPAPGFLNYPWEVTYATNDNQLWVTESRGYKVYKINPNTGAKTTVLDISKTTGSFPGTFNALFNTADVPATVPKWPQGGLAGLAIHPLFGDGTHDFVYISYIRSYTGGVQSGGNGIFFVNRVVRFTYNGTSLVSPVSLCDTLPGSDDHNSQRMFIAPVGGTNYLFYAAGDMGGGQLDDFNRPNKAQDSTAYEGKILRFNLEPDADAGTLDKWIPNDNPYNTTSPAKQSAIWCIGIRNNQGFAYDPVSDILYGSSHGPYSDDEINILQRYKNYGHPLVIGYADDGSGAGNYNGSGAGRTNGASTTCPLITSEVTNKNTINASGFAPYKDPMFSAYAGPMPTAMAGSVYNIWHAASTPGNATWPSEGWSGMELYTNKIIPAWKQSLILGGLKWGRVLRLKLGASGTITLPSNNPINNAGDTITHFQSVNRYRDLAFAPNGKDIFIIMDNTSATSGPGTNNPVTPACPGCLIKYSFLGYADAAGLSTIPKSIDVADGPVNTCNTGTTVTIDGSNNFLWVPITGPDGNIMAEIKANGNNLGLVTSSFYKNSGAIRNKGGVRYLDRNITITVATQPGSTVNIRLYISKTEFDALDADASSGLTGTGNIGLLKILKNADPCRATALGITTTIIPTNTLLADLTHGSNGYVLQGDISGFSSFYFGTSNILLPLDLLTFTGSLQSNNTTLLKWQTENEINTSHFDVERSLDGNIFNSIGSVAASGNSSSAINYSFTDKDATNQQSLILYYRLKMIDQNGNYKYSNVITISLADITGKVVVAPNPVVNEVKVAISAPQDGKVQWKLIDNTGRVIMQNAIPVRKGNGNNITINMHKLANGPYYLSINGAGINQKIKLQKL